jgi:hypothetical protein
MPRAALSGVKTFDKLHLARMVDCVARYAEYEIETLGFC